MPCNFNNNYPCSASPCSQNRTCPYSYPCPQQDYRYNQDWGNLFWLVLSLVLMVWTVNAIVEVRYSGSKSDSELQLQYVKDR
ncbi:hypothetical protein PCC9214_03000 [Planktothrix tepida]|uniref:Uncharacterized protein n=1 Tax=Planktothrix tepida PCC 9214 TaxID=671072 RepID=A0A1J1LNK2_9CYAN|nr:hypothetical protein [Planktothrix tepida]CAD5958171.1 hypothetical protein PCC9214_03000 [Planktothrix tepida]CUR33999.1 hypothetical protein PL9214640006 [Planktothrix tepida PCC 9214]